MATLSSHSHHDGINSAMSHHYAAHHQFAGSQQQQQSPLSHHLPVPQPLSMPSQRRRGVTKFFNSLKGYGFAVDQHPEELGGQEVFVHFSAISGKGGFRSLAEGEEVEYELVQGPKGFQAVNLTGPGGRNVVGDPKARLTKPPTYMPFAPMSMHSALSAPYISDPYQQQHPGVYSNSPYTQHVVYMPASMQNGPQSQSQGSQYPPSSHSQTSPLYLGGHTGGSTGSSDLSSVFSGLSLGGSGGSGSGSSQQPYAYQSHASSSFPSGPSASYPSSLQKNGNGNPLGGRIPNYGSFSPPGSAYPSFGDSQNGPASVFARTSHVTGNMSKAIGGGPPGGSSFAPFNSPPSFNNAPLFGDHPASYSGSNAISSGPPRSSSPPHIPSSTSFGVSSIPSSASTTSSLPRSASGASGGLPPTQQHGGSVAAGGAAERGPGSLFGGSSSSSNPAGAVGAPRPSSTTAVATAGSRTATPAERRNTPLGNGSLNGNGGFGSVLYASSNERDFSS